MKTKQTYLSTINLEKEKNENPLIIKKQRLSCEGKTMKHKSFIFFMKINICFYFVSCYVME